MLKFSGSLILRLSSRGTRPALRKYSSYTAPIQRADQLNTSSSVAAKIDDLSDDDKDNKGKNKGLIAAAFATLNTPESEIKKPSPKSVKISRVQKLDTQIQKANDVNSLLVVAENPVVSRKHALKMVSVLSEWSSNNKVKLSDFEKDPRFLKLCRILARTPTSQAINSLTMAEDLGTVLGITGDDEAARLIMNLSLPQMVKVMKALQQKGRRSTPLLRAIANNITKQTEVIDLKKSADLLFCMASLNFPDPVLLDRLCNDIIKCLPSNKDKVAVVNSIVVSLGLLKWGFEARLSAPSDDIIQCLPSNKDKVAVVNSIMVSLGLLKWRSEACLSALCEWLAPRGALNRASDVASTTLTLATVDFVPPEGEGLIEAAIALKEEEMPKPTAWLDLVFSLLTLNRAEKRHLVSTLQPEFIDKLLSTGEISIPSRRKLMVIDAYTSLVHPASPRLAEDVSVGVPLLHTKEKALYVNSIMDTFKSLVSAEAFLKKNIDSGMGFLYDAEFAVDAKCHPVPLEKAVNSKDVFRIAVLALDYHDMTRNTPAPLGVYQLYTRVLLLKGYKVLQIPFTEFNPKDKLVTRVQYIEKRLKEIISKSPPS